MHSQSVINHMGRYKGRDVRGSVEAVSERTAAKWILLSDGRSCTAAIETLLSGERPHQFEDISRPPTPTNFLFLALAVLRPEPCYTTECLQISKTIGN